MGVGLSGFAVWDFQVPTLVSMPSGVPGFLVFVLPGRFLIRIPLCHVRGYVAMTPSDLGQDLHCSRRHLRS